MNISKEKLRKLATITITRHNEDRHFEDDFDHPDDIAWVRESLENGNEWAWCVVQVTVEFHGISATDYLGGCSYTSAQDFREGGYFEDMVDNCLDDLKVRLEALYSATKETA